MSKGIAVCVGLILLTTVVGAFGDPTVKSIYSGVETPIGGDYDQEHDRLYFVEYNKGTLEYIELWSLAHTYWIHEIVSSGLEYPEDVALDLAANCAYVTTRVGEGTGTFVRVDLASGAKQTLARGLGAPSQIALDLAGDCAYTVGFDSGILWRIDLNTGAAQELARGLALPVGLAVSIQRGVAYVGQEGSNSIGIFGLADGILREEIPTASLTDFLPWPTPFFLTWMSARQDALLVAEHGAVCRVSRVDIATREVSTVVQYAAGDPSPNEVIMAPGGNTAYITASHAEKHAIQELTIFDPEALGGNFFTAVGYIPKGRIVNGYASTEGYFYPVRNAPFGGTLNIYGALTTRASEGYEKYRVEVQRPGSASFAPILGVSWTTYQKDPVTGETQLVAISPDADGWYTFSSALRRYDPDTWVPPSLLIRWPTPLGDDGLYTLRVTFRRANGDTVASTGGELLRLQIDNSPPVAQLTTLLCSPCGSHSCDAARPCLVVGGNDCILFQVDAYDPSGLGHLLEWELSAAYAKTGAKLAGEVYSGTGPWRGVVGYGFPSASSSGWEAPCNCAYLISLTVYKRTTTGDGSPSAVAWDRTTLSISNAGDSCP